MAVPILDLKEQYRTIREEVDSAIQGVLEAGDFILWGRVMPDGLEDNSLWISMDDGEYVLWDIQPRSEKAWVWNRVSNRGVSGPVLYHLDTGLHTLVIKNREDGTRIDRILITNDIDYVPTQLGE